MFSSVKRAHHRLGFAGPLLTVAAPLIATVLIPTAGHAEGIVPKAGVSIVVIMFRDRCDGGTDVEVPNPYTTGKLVFDINAELVVVGPGERPWQAVPAPTNGTKLTTKVSVKNQAGTVEKTTHHWSQPAGCSTASTLVKPGDSAADSSAGSDSGSASDSAAADGYGAGDGYGADTGSDAGTLSAAGAVDGNPASGVSDRSRILPVDRSSTLPLTGTKIWPLVGGGLFITVAGALLVGARRRKVRFTTE